MSGRTHTTKNVAVPVQLESPRQATKGAHTGIPDLEADSRIGIAIDNLFGHETSTDSRGGLSRVELALAVAGDEGCFADPLGAENDDLGLEGRHDFR